jgi:hypothetical protein
MYCNQINFGALIILALGLSACASNPAQSDHASPIQDQDTSKSGETGQKVPDHFSDRTVDAQKLDGREPSSMKGDFTWLNDVEDEFGRVAAETSSRAVASQNKHEVLMKQKEWIFTYLPKTNHFYVEVQGTQYQLVQTGLGDGDRYAFAAEGQSENPITFSVSRGDGRSVASGKPAASCGTEISYWSDSAKSYMTERKDVTGKSCERMLGLLKDYVP